MEDAQGFGHFLSQADWVAKTILVLMAGASLTSWYLIVTKSMSGAQARRRSEKFLKFFWNAPSIEVVGRELDGKIPDNAFAHLAQQGIIAAQHHERHAAHRLHEAGTPTEFLTRALRRTIDEETSEMESGLTVLASIGATAPFVGLLGTVWGIYHALLAISRSGSGTLDKVAGPVGEALIMTAIGLAVAIPAVLGYNFIVRSNRITLARLDGFAHDLFTFLVTGAKVGSTAPPAVPARARATQDA